MLPTVGVNFSVWDGLRRRNGYILKIVDDIALTIVLTTKEKEHKKTIKKIIMKDPSASSQYFFKIYKLKKIKPNEKNKVSDIDIKLMKRIIVQERLAILRKALVDKILIANDKAEIGDHLGCKELINILHTFLNAPGMSSKIKTKLKESFSEKEYLILKKQWEEIYELAERDVKEMLTIVENFEKK